jgi:MFS family permease
VLGLLRRIAVDITPLRESRDFRWLSLGQIVSGLGTQAALVALPYQIYVTSHSAALVGLLGAFELGPMVVVSLIGGALLDRRDRKPVLALAQVGLICSVGALCALSLAASKPPVLAVLLLGGVIAGCSSLDSVSRSAIIPGVLGPERLTSGLAFSYGTSQATSIVGPGVGGLLIAAFGVGSTYAIEAATSVAMLATVLMISAQPPAGLAAGTEHPPVRAAIAEGLRFVASDKALSGSFVIDINAMMFGMPRALFAVLSLTVYHAGASGTGLLYAAIAFGGTVSVLTSGWISGARRIGRIVIACVFLWGLAILGAGLVRTIAPAVVLLAVAGWADGISAVCRQAIAQSLTPDRLRGRMGAVFSLVVSSGPRLGDIESGLVAGLVGALNSVLIGGVACVVGVGAVMVTFPQLATFDAQEALARMREDGVDGPAAVTVEAAQT